jgi:hypothetical protein
MTPEGRAANDAYYLPEAAFDPTVVPVPDADRERIALLRGPLVHVYAAADRSSRRPVARRFCGGLALGWPHTSG